MGCGVEMKENNCLKELRPWACKLFCTCSDSPCDNPRNSDPEPHVSFKAAGLWYWIRLEQASYLLQGFNSSQRNSNINLREGSAELKFQAHGTWSSGSSSFQVILTLLMLIGRYFFCGEIVSPDLGISCA